MATYYVAYPSGMGTLQSSGGATKRFKTRAGAVRAEAERHARFPTMPGPHGGRVAYPRGTIEVWEESANYRSAHGQSRSKRTASRSARRAGKR